jgi:cytochrome c-type biogenesis protein
MSSLPLPIFAFVAGLASFLSPCVFPLVPGYMVLISGAGMDQAQTGEPRLMRTVLLHSLMFILGFTVVFITLGAAATGISQLAHEYKKYLTIAAGAAIVIFGLHMTGVFRIKALYGDKRMHSLGHGKSPIGAFLVGFAFAFGWTPCIGPFLATILALAGSASTLAKGVFLLWVYSLGLAVPFFLAALFVERFLNFSRGFKPFMKFVEVAGGVLLVAIGALMLSGRFASLSKYFSFLDRFAM